MPSKPSTICNRCRRPYKGRCECWGPRGNHAAKTTERGYGSDWQKFRKQVIAERPICEDCIERGIVTPTKEVHHLVKIKHDPTRRLDPQNVKALCEACHDARTARGE